MLSAAKSPVDPYEIFLRTECGYCERTVTRNMRTVRRITEHVGAAPHKATLDQLTAWVQHESAQGIGSETLGGMISTLRCYLRFYGKSELAARLERPRVTVAIPAIPNIEEAARLLESAPIGTRDRGILEALYGSGLRAHEVCGLTIDAIGSDRTARIMGKGRKERIVPVTICFAACAEALSVGRVRTDPLFITRRGKPLHPNQVWRIVKRYAKMSNQRVPMHPHTLRHACATHLLTTGQASLEMIRQLLGHEDVNMTARYLHMDPHERQRVMRVYHPHERMARGESPWIPVVDQKRPPLPALVLN